MPSGSCVCGDFKYEIPEAPTQVVLCHCRPCRKFAGSNGSVNSVVPLDQFKHISGEVKSFQRTGDSGKLVNYSLCDKCGTVMWVDAEAMPGMRIYKPGTLDDRAVLDGAKPVMEVYTKDRPTCWDSIKDTAQAHAQPA